MYNNNNNQQQQQKKRIQQGSFVGTNTYQTQPDKNKIKNFTI